MYNQKHLLLQRFKEFYTGRVHPDADVKYDQVFLDIAAKFHVCFDALSLSAFQPYSFGKRKEIALSASLKLLT